MNETIEQAALRIGKEVFGADECCLSGEGERDRKVTVGEYPIGEDCIKFANRIAALVAAAERERIAQLCENNCAGISYDRNNQGPCLTTFDKECGGRHDGMTYAAAIRALT